MFSTQKYLEKKTGSSGVGRFNYLQALVTEFQDTHKQGTGARTLRKSFNCTQKKKMKCNISLKNLDSKRQILANLANFAYDPINYEFFRRLNILDLFLGTCPV